MEDQGDATFEGFMEIDGRDCPWDMTGQLALVRNRDSSVDIVTGHELGGRGSIPLRSSRFWDTFRGLRTQCTSVARETVN
jgi:hypothetical protein